MYGWEFPEAVRHQSFPRLFDLLGGDFLEGLRASQSALNPWPGSAIPGLSLPVARSDLTGAGCVVLPTHRRD
jgi:hypothetical protein